MRKWIVKREKDSVVVCILKNKSDNTYSFVNLTKGHICTCKFTSVEEALMDMENQKKERKIIDYIEIDENVKNDLISRELLLNSIDDRYKEKIAYCQDNMAEGFFQMEKLIKEQPIVMSDMLIDE